MYSASVVMWRTEDGGTNWSAVRGAPGGDDYQKIWINPNDSKIIFTVADQGAVVSANRGVSWSNWYTSRRRRCTTSPPTTRSRIACAAASRTRAPACVASRSMDGEITFHDWHPVNIQEYGIAAPDPKDPDMVFGSARTNVSLYNRRTGQTTNVGPSTDQRAGGFGRNVRTMPIAWSPVDNTTLYLHVERRVEVDRPRAQLDAHQPRSHAADVGGAGRTPGKYASTVTPAPLGSITALSLSPRSLSVIWAGTDDGNIQVTTDGGDEMDERHAARDQAVDAHLQHRGRPLRQSHGVRRREHDAASTT